MLNIKAFIALTALSLLAAPNAFAGDTTTQETQFQKAEAHIDQRVSQQARVIYAKMEESPEVLGAVANGDVIQVMDETGKVYFNQIIPIDSLPDPTLSMTTIDTETYTYKGRIYTNKIVQTN